MTEIQSVAFSRKADVSKGDRLQKHSNVQIVYGRQENQAQFLLELAERGACFMQKTALINPPTNILY